ncbi:hypothetical protein P4U99_09670 [Brevibacillus agri]|uniref:hypothetical protein n=1 Tax=Brevibacillus agri TaxID=51101 RepID=UPI002E1D26F0|nr:hypothetical protein [Brevibacillus agri]MED1653544.1 hypothetical protein [Brevibacillus agri]MED1685215.1 hypothetical protein [Brevibacillus agri]MED1690776.1 hypothetical protein [Brevibacillus agri]MED1697417.1 hypothetical protein [Brevibacillus agri]
MAVIEILFYVLFLLFVGFLALYPRAIWEYVSKHGTSQDEPSAFYFDMLRIVAGALFAVLILVGFVYNE